MNVQVLSQTLSDIFAAASSRTPDGFAFLGAMALEALAVGALMFIGIAGAGRLMVGTASRLLDMARVSRGLDPFILPKLIIPIACLTLTVWIWMATQQA